MQPPSTAGADEQRSVPSSSSLVRGVERFAHFVIYRREDGEFDVLGAGAMGITYRAFDTQLERPVALKVIHPQCMHEPEVRSRFAREAKAAARLQHPNIASVLFQGEEEGVCFYAMELVAGENLHSYVARVGALSPVHALQMAHQIALALVSASKEGVLHRDLKPSNVMLTSYHEGAAPHLKVIDFGLAKLSSEISGTFTTGGFLGTPEFASPEQCEEQPLDARSDLYSLGATLWFLLTAQAPFSGSMLAIMKSHVSAPPPFESLQDAPEPLLKVLRRLLAKNRDDRPATPLEAAREIDSAIRILAPDRKNYTPLRMELAGATGAGAHSQRSPKRRRVAVVTAVGVTCSAAAIGVFMFFGKGKQAGSNMGAGQSAQTSLPVDRPVPAGPPALASRSATATGAGPEDARTNSLGMEFVRVPGTEALFSVWETRVRDFVAFNRATGLATANAGSAEKPGWSAPGFAQDENHPVVFVSVEDAIRFCEWLTTVERKEGRIADDEEYRLPSRREWDSAVGAMMPPKGGRGPGGPPPGWGADFLPGDGPQTRGNKGLRSRKPGEPLRDAARAESHPEEEDDHRRPPPPYYWFNHTWPPPSGFANYADESAGEAGAVQEVISGWTDGFAFTAPVGRFRANPYGLRDISGNVWEMCHNGPPGAAAYGILGGSWASGKPEDLQLHQITTVAPKECNAQIGFRCVLAPRR